MKKPQEKTKQGETATEPGQEPFAPAGGIILDADEVEVLKKTFGFEIDKKMKQSAWVLNQGKSDDPEKLAHKIEVYQSILKKIKYEPKPYTPGNNNGTRPKSYGKFQKQQKEELPEDAYF